MYGKGILMQSIRKASESDSKIVIESDTSYSEIHNSGGYIVVTAQMKRFFWAKYYDFVSKVKTTKRGERSKSAVNTKTNAKAEFCKRMALMKVGTKIKIPKHQFIGHSYVMLKQFETWWTGQVETSFKQHLNNQ